MEEEIQGRTDTLNDDVTDVWSMYPMNVYTATTASTGGGFSLQNKKVVAVVVFIGLSIVITILGYLGGKEFGVGLLGAIVGLLVGIILSMYLYAKLLRDKFNESFESDTQNKVLKLFRIRLNDNETDNTINGVELMTYTSGEIFTTLRIEIGNSSDSTEEVTAEFLDRVFKAAHQLNLTVKNYNIRSEWRKSDVHDNHLKRLSKVQDQKLKATLAGIDSHQSEIFDHSKVIAIHLAFVTRRNNIHGLEGIISLVDDWKKDYLFMSSIRTLEWLNKDKVIEALCNFLTIQMLDVTSSLNKKNIKYDIRKMVRVYSRNRFNPQDHINVESKASLIRKSKKVSSK